MTVTTTTQSVHALRLRPDQAQSWHDTSDGLEARVGDLIEYGIDVGNSELGLRSVQVTPMNYRLLCTNGMRGGFGGAAMRMRHVGDARRLAERLREAIPAALEDAQTHIDYWRRATDTRARRRRGAEVAATLRHEPPRHRRLASAALRRARGSGRP